jgi:hypothetical protein
LLRFAPIIILFCLIPNIALAEWKDIEPYRNTGVPNSLGDIYNHTPPILPGEAEAMRRYGGATLYHNSGDDITKGHETSHVLHARLMILLKAENVFYMLHGRCFVTDSPSITLQQIANTVPANKRGPNYSLYLVTQQDYHNNRPFYVIDEYIAYINGCLVGLDINEKARTVDSYNHVIEFKEYVDVAQELSRKSGFKEQKELDEFLDFVYNQRILWLEKKLNDRNWLVK